MWVKWEGGGWLAEVWEDKEEGGEWRRGGMGARQGQKEPIEMQIASLNSITRLSFDVK